MRISKLPKKTKLGEGLNHLLFCLSNYLLSKQSLLLLLVINLLFLSSVYTLGSDCTLVKIQEGL